MIAEGEKFTKLGQAERVESEEKRELLEGIRTLVKRDGRRRVGFRFNELFFSPPPLEEPLPWSIDGRDY
tara:strand:+ start:316 stop:522 length:207 start_codon:yes stop_codon:yes gene_type:complete